MEVQARKFYSQRNMYLCGFTLFLSLILNRTYVMILDQLRLEEEVKRLSGDPKAKTSDGKLDQAGGLAEIGRLKKELAQKESLRYNEVLIDDILKTGGESVLHALEQAELISIVSGANGRPSIIKPGKPVYHPAFKRLTEDKVLKSRMDLAVLTHLTKIENATIEKCENELLLLSKLRNQPAQTAGRVTYLLTKLMASQIKVEKYETEMKGLKKVIASEY